MMASARLESNVLMVIFNYGGAGLAKEACKKPHAARLIILESLASERDDNARKSVADIVQMLREFNRERNHVAHNPLMYALDENSKENHRYGAITSIVDPERRVGLDEIIALAEKGEGLASHFTFTWMMAMGAPK